jgi:hypothetical protein
MLSLVAIANRNQRLFPAEDQLSRPAAPVGSL